MTETRVVSEEWKEAIRNAGLSEADIVTVEVDGQHFGNAQAVFRLGSVLLKLERDRGQDFVSLAFESMPDIFYPIEDVEVAMRWIEPGEVYTRKSPEELTVVLGRLAEGLADLIELVAGQGEGFARARIERATLQRQQAWMDRLTR